MATTNVIITCDHCYSKIRVRVGIGYSPKQPFAFSCKKCGTHIQGALILKEPPDVEFEFNNATINNEIELKDAEFIVECHEDFLITNEPIQGDIYKPTPYMRAFSLMEDNIFEFGKDISLSSLNQKELKNKLFRLNNFYINDQNSEFKIESENLINSNSINEIYKSLIQLNEIYFIPILNKQQVYSNNSLFKNEILKLLNDKSTFVFNFIGKLESLNFFNNQLKENLQLMERFDDLFFEIKPIITLNYMDIANKDFLNFSILDFNKTKQFYIDIFECVGREINALIGLRNIDFNNDFNNLNIPQFRNINNFAKCMTSTNGNKKKFLENSPYNILINDIFDNKLRNGLGHYKCQLNLSTMIIDYYPYKDDITKSKKESISYTDFISKLYDLFNLLISLMYLKALFFSIYYANKSKATLSLKNVNLIVINESPTVRLFYYWNGTDYSNSEITTHNFNYWNFFDIYSIFDNPNIEVEFDDEFIFVKMYKKNLYKFKISENLDWFNHLSNTGNFEIEQQSTNSVIPFFNAELAIPKIL